LSYPGTVFEVYRRSDVIRKTANADASLTDIFCSGASTTACASVPR